VDYQGDEQPVYANRAGGAGDVVDGGAGEVVPIWQIFPYAVAVLELCAAAVYVYYGEWRLVIIWTGVGIANMAFAGVK
jgi:hypothetical protein